MREQTRKRGSRLPSELLDGPVYEFASRYTLTLKVLPKVKTANKPKFNTMFVRKFMILIYLLDIEQKQGFFSVFSIQSHFRQSLSRYAAEYFDQLARDSWIVPIDTDLPKHKRAVLSPLFFSLMRAITTHLRREHPERFTPAISASAEQLRPDDPTLSQVEDIPDLR